MDFVAPPHWRTIDFLSDIHLDASAPATFALWHSYLASTQADAVFILGDLFEVWVGDDILNLPGAFEHQCVSALRSAGFRTDLFIMVGNRDFLMSAALMECCNARAIADPCTLVFHGQRFVLSHGDALCVDDVDYQQFRKSVRSAQWQDDFLARPLSERQAIARSIRMQSEAKKSSNLAAIDVDASAATELLGEHSADILIHGHTHQPGEVQLPGGRRRLVLSDWVADAAPARADVLRLTATDTSTVRVTRLTGDAIANAQG